MRSNALQRDLRLNLRFFFGITLVLVIVPSPSAFGENRLARVEVGQVRVGGEIGRRIDLTVDENLMKLDLDKDFLQPFRDRKGIAGSSHQQRYVGLGKLIDATVSFAACKGMRKVIALKNRMIDELIKTQLPDGYMGIFEEKHRITTYWDLHEMVYLIHGLVADYNRFGDTVSLDAARRLGDYITKNRQPAERPRSVGKLNTERAFLALYRATGERKYLDYAVASEELDQWDAAVQGHAYTFMNLCLAQLDLYDINPNDALLGQSRKVFDYLLAGDGLIASGTCSRNEGWHDDQVLTGMLGETCATAYLIRLLHAMLRIEGDSIHGDAMERAIYNALFAAQLPGGRRLRYFAPLEGKRPYFPFDTYCCPCNFRRIIAELPEMIYYRSKVGGLAVNLYTPSRATVELRDDLTVSVRQETDYPTTGKVTINVDPSRPAGFPLQLRIPAWCRDAGVSVNGQEVEQPIRSGSFLAVDREWRPGDRVDLSLPMSWRLVRGRKAQQGRAAVLRGPVLYCLDPGRMLAMNPQLAKGNTDRMEDTPSPESKLAKEQPSDPRLTFEDDDPSPITVEFLKGLRLDPRSFGEPVEDSAARPNGLACPVRAWSPGRSTDEAPDLKLLLTEFPDPRGEATYFLLPDGSATVEDELIRNS